MDLYVLSRGFHQDDDYHWRSLERPATAWGRAEPAELLRAADLDGLLDRPADLTCRLGTHAQRQYLFLSVLAADARRDFFGSPIRDTVIILGGREPLHAARALWRSPGRTTRALRRRIALTEDGFDATAVARWATRTARRGRWRRPCPLESGATMLLRMPDGRP